MSIQIENLSCRYSSRIVLRDISLSIGSNTLLCVLGPNGVGKSTLFKCILGLLPYRQGKITINDRNQKEYSDRELARCVAYIPQSHASNFNFTVSDIVLMGTTCQVSSFKAPGKHQQELAEEAMERVGISHLRDRGYIQISGGERQLVLIARALAQQAKILIMDEPTANLDYGNQTRILQCVKNLAKEDYTIIQSTHNPDQTFIYADEVLALWEGEILARGTPHKIITEELIRTLYNIDVQLEKLCDDEIRVCIPKSVIHK